MSPTPLLPPDTVAPRRIDAGDAPPEERCRALEGPSRDAEGELGCPSHPERRTRLLAEVTRAAAEGAVRLAGLDRIARLPPLEAGACDACLTRLQAELAASYGDAERFTPPRLPEAWRAEEDRLLAELPFVREHLLARHRRPAELARALFAAARASARAVGRASELAVELTGLSPMLPLLAAGADRILLRADAVAGARLALELAAAAGPRAVSLQAPAHGAPAERLRALYEATALGFELHGEALAEAPMSATFPTLVRFLHALPAAPTRLCDVAILYDARCDVLTAGAHGRLSQRAAAVLGGAGFTVGACATVAAAPRGAALLLAGATALWGREARALARRVREGGDAVLWGRAQAVDDEALPLASALDGLRVGENALGRGRLRLAEPGATTEEALLHAVRTAVPDALRLLRVTGRAELVCGVRRGAETAQVHLANLALDGERFVPPEGLVLHLGGALREARTASLRAPDGTDEPLRVNASARGTSLVLPKLPPYAALLLG